MKSDPEHGNGQAAAFFGACMRMLNNLQITTHGIAHAIVKKTTHTHTHTHRYKKKAGIPLDKFFTTVI